MPPAEALSATKLFLPPLIVGGFAAFAAFWCAVCYLLSHMSGWQRLAQQFATKTQPQGRRFPMAHAFVNAVQYKGVLTIYVGPQGLSLAVWKPFGLGHQSLLIPWENFSAFTSKRVFLGELNETTVSLATGETVKLTFLRRSIAEAIEPYVRG